MLKRIAIVTGASSGLGRRFAVQAAGSGEYDAVWVVARRAERLADLCAEYPVCVPVPLDLAERSSFDVLRTRLEEAGAEVTLLVCAAGFGKFGACTDLTPREIEDMIAVNCNAVVLCAHTVLPYMPDGSRIIVMGSSSSFQPLPYFSLYAASKAFVVSFCRALHQELKPRKISVTAVCPGYVRTAFFDVAKETANPDACNEFKPLYEPEPVVDQAYRDAARGRDMSVHGLFVKTHRLLAKLLPNKAVMRVWMHIK